MTFSENTNPNNAFGTTDNDPLAAGLPPLYEDGITDDGLSQPGSSDPVTGAEFVVVDDPAIVPESEGSTGTEDPILGDSSETENSTVGWTQTALRTWEEPIESSDPENPLDPLINPGNEAIEETESAAGDESDDTSAIETEVEPTDTTSENDTHEPEVLPQTTAEDSDSASEENGNDAEAVTTENDDAEEESLADEAEVAVEPEATQTPTVEDFNFTQIQSGIFTANSDGIVRIDYLFDDGKFESEVAIFSLDGMEELWSADNPRQFIAEAARRSISNSELGGIAISDATEGARFSDAKNHFNSGAYAGVKTLQMRPGDRFAVMVVPNGTVRALLDKLEIGHLPRTLFSIAEFNRNGDAYFVQATNGNGDGDVFAFEDLRLDGNSDRDFNDIVFQLRGATGSVTPLDDILDPTQGWWSKDVGQELRNYSEPNFDSRT